MSNPSPTALATGKNPIIYQQSFSAATFNNASFGTIELAPWKAVVIIVDQVVFTGGASPTLQMDAVIVFPDGSTFDYFNNGAHTGSFSFTIGPVASTNVSLCPEFLQFGPSIVGAPTNVAFRVTIIGII